MDQHRQLPSGGLRVEAVDCVSGKGNDLLDNDKEDVATLLSGMNVFKGTTPKRVCTFFPLELLDYLHVDHAKAALLNGTYYTYEHKQLKIY